MYKKLAVLLASLIFTLALASNTFAVEAETDSAKFVRLTRALEVDPLQVHAKQMRTWLLSWAQESPDVSVKVCDILGPIPRDKVPYGSELLTQSVFGNAAFQIEHPDKKGDELAAQTAGVSSLLKAYKAILASHPDAHIPYFDDLLARQAAGSLTKFLAPQVAVKCSDNSSA